MLTPAHYNKRIKADHFHTSGLLWCFTQTGLCLEQDEPFTKPDKTLLISDGEKRFLKLFLKGWVVIKRSWVASSTTFMSPRGLVLTFVFLLLMKGTNWRQTDDILTRSRTTFRTVLENVASRNSGDPPVNSCTCRAAPSTAADRAIITTVYCAEEISLI